MSPRAARALWVCPRCGRSFAATDQAHTCAAPRDVEAAFARSEPDVRAAFDRIVDVARALGPTDVVPERSRIALHVRMSFAALQPRRDRLDGHLVLARHTEHPRFVRVRALSPRNVVHEFRLASVADVDAAFAARIAEAWSVGAQHHLAGPSAPDDVAAVRADLLRAELALASRDPAFGPDGLAAFLADPFLEFAASGRRWDREATVALLATSASGPVEITDFEVALLAPDLALVTYRLRAPRDGVPTTTIRTSVWRRTGADAPWQIAFHQGSPSTA